MVGQWHPKANNPAVTIGRRFASARCLVVEDMAKRGRLPAVDAGHDEVMLSDCRRLARAINVFAASSGSRHRRMVLIIFDLPGKPVAAKQEYVAGAKGRAPQVDGDLGGWADGRVMNRGKRRHFDSSHFPHRRFPTQTVVKVNCSRSLPRSRNSAVADVGNDLPQAQQQGATVVPMPRSSSD